MAAAVNIPISELKSFVGQRLGPSAWVTVTQDRIRAFADATGDHQWIHLDEERAKRESPRRRWIDLLHSRIGRVV